jgi:hypothetical protein
VKHLLQDLWLDLRERRLVPVAAVLALALVVAPALLLKGAPAEPVAAVPSTNAAEPPALVTTASLAEPSALDEFAAKNPFRPLRSLAPATSAASASGSSNPFNAGNGPAKTANAGSGGGGSAPSGAVGGKAPGSGPSSPNKLVPPSQLTPTTPAKPRTRKYTYVVDLTLVRGQTAKTFERFGRLGLLPSRREPLVIFLGVDARGNNAAFMVDSSLRAVGEGRCQPRPDQCSLLYLGPGEEDQLVKQDGTAFTVRLDQIRRVPVEAAAHDSAVRARRARARAGAGATRSFLPPVLTDLVETGAER